MPKLIRARDNHNATIVEPGHGPLTLSYFNLLRLRAGEAETIGYVFTILVGRNQRSLVQYFEPSHQHLMGKIPGIDAMREKFK